MTVPTLLLAESYLYRLDPVAIPISPSMGVRWYGLAYATGLLIAWLTIRWMARTGRSVVPERAVGDLMVYAVIGVLAGGRLGYAVFYQPSLLWSFTSSPPWWELLAFWHGGMASHGGIVGVIVAMLVFAWRHHLPGLHLLDLAALTAPPGLFLGRLANFINGELWGKPLAVALQASPPWWSVKYPEELYSRGIDVSEVAEHFGEDPASFGEDPSDLTVVVEALSEGDPVVVSDIVPRLTAFWPSQLIQAFAEGPMLLMVLIAVWWVPRRPGIIAGTFAVTYGSLRIVTELFRQPDGGVAILLGLQRGQLLSVGLIVLGLVMLWCFGHRKTRHLGGLGRPALSGD